MMRVCPLGWEKIIPLLVNCGGILVSIVAIVTTLTHRNIKRSQRGILVSFLIGNLVSGGIFVYDIVAYVCEVYLPVLSIVFKVSTVLWLSHILLLLVHHRVSITSNRTELRDFIGLILTTWIASATLGCVNATLKHSITKILDIIFLVVALVLIARSLNSIKKEYRQQEENGIIYKNQFLQASEETTTQAKVRDDDLYPPPPINEWDFKFVTVLTTAFVVCSIPWLVVNTKGLETVERGAEHAVPVSIYSISYYVLAFACMYLRCRHVGCCQAFVVRCPSSESKKRNSMHDLVSHMESDENYGTFRAVDDFGNMVQ